RVAGAADLQCPARNRMDAGGGGDGSRPHRREPRPVAQSRDPLGPQFFERAADRAGHRVPDRRGPQRGCRRGAVVSELRASLPEQESLMAAPRRDLAQACRDHYSRPTALALWVLCEVAIAACDLAEVIGSAIGLNLLFGIPLPWGIAITALDVLIVLFLQNKGFRLLEALVVALIATIAGCFLFEIFISRPDLGAVAGGFVPRASILADPAKLYIAIGILGATVMPHNLYLHSSVVQTRAYEETTAGKRMAVKYAFIDSTIALCFALFINARSEERR